MQPLLHAISIGPLLGMAILEDALDSVLNVLF